MKILYASSEALPFIASGGLADVAGSLPKALRNKKTACRVVIPYYSHISGELKQKCRFLTSFNVSLAWREQYCGVFSANIDGVVYYLLDNEYYFDRGQLYGEFDDGERFAFFSAAILELIRHIDFVPDIIHCNDWQTGLVPIFLNAFYRGEYRYRFIKTVFTIHNIQYQGQFSDFFFDDVCGLPGEFKNVVDYNGGVNILKGAMQEADRITTVSESYAKEITTAEYAYGLERFINDNSFKLRGIVNGLDVKHYNPREDKVIKKQFSEKTLGDKEINKKALLEEFSVPYEEGVPTVAMVTRLVPPKGMDIVVSSFEELMKRNIKFILLGSGEARYENFFREMKDRYPDKVGVYIGFSPKTASAVYAGADIFLMPSLSEPCGLAQLVALRYGTIPIVHEAGGLRDTVKDYTTSGGNGFSFKDTDSNALLWAVDNAIGTYHKKDEWEKLKVSAMTADYSWNKSAEKYLEVYKEI
jgi:starch synthase